VIGFWCVLYLLGVAPTAVYFLRTWDPNQVDEWGTRIFIAAAAVLWPLALAWLTLERLSEWMWG
jgi:hypothetical protein